jgi:glycosyltransferase involved in cell wall biosynthesis
VSAFGRRLRGLVERPELAIDYRFRPAPYGGSNQFLTALRSELRRRGFRVSAGAVAPRTRACLLHSYLVDVAELRSALPASCRVVHRVDGPITLYRGRDDGADRRIVEINDRLAHATIVQSRWSLEAHRELGIELREPVVVPNAVDPAIFHPPRAREPLGRRRLRVVATSWSDNPRKGAGTFAWLARNVDPDRFEFTFVGRGADTESPMRVVAPLASGALAELLRRQDVYVAASLADPCSNAVLEALACGLPVLYARSGGHPELVGDAGFGFDDGAELPQLLDRLAEELEERRRLIAVPALADVADRYVAALGLGRE